MLLCFCKEFVDSPYKICWHSLVSIAYGGTQLSLVTTTHLCTFRRVFIFQRSLLKLPSFYSIVLIQYQLYLAPQIL